MKIFLTAIALSSTIGTTTLIALSTAEAHRVRHCRVTKWPHNQWGYVGLMRGGSGLGGVADAPWVGGSIIGLSSYGPYPYGYYPFLRP